MALRVVWCRAVLGSWVAKMVAGARSLWTGINGVGFDNAPNKKAPNGAVAFSKN
jgi:hypothetical protein